jgi:hypothetical protein
MQGASWAHGLGATGQSGSFDPTPGFLAAEGIGVPYYSLNLGRGVQRPLRPNTSRRRLALLRVLPGLLYQLSGLTYFFGNFFGNSSGQIKFGKSTPL